MRTQHRPRYIAARMDQHWGQLCWNRKDKKSKNKNKQQQLINNIQLKEMMLNLRTGYDVSSRKKRESVLREALKSSVRMKISFYQKDRIVLLLLFYTFRSHYCFKGELSLFSIV